MVTTLLCPKHCPAQLSLGSGAGPPLLLRLDPHLHSHLADRHAARKQWEPFPPSRAPWHKNNTNTQQAHTHTETLTHTHTQTRSRDNRCYRAGSSCETRARLRDAGKLASTNVRELTHVKNMGKIGKTFGGKGLFKRGAVTISANVSHDNFITIKGISLVTQK